MFAKNTTKFSLKSYSTEIHKNYAERHEGFFDFLTLCKIFHKIQNLMFWFQDLFLILKVISIPEKIFPA